MLFSGFLSIRGLLSTLESAVVDECHCPNAAKRASVARLSSARASQSAICSSTQLPDVSFDPSFGKNPKYRMSSSPVFPSKAQLFLDTFLPPPY
ncbi:hypothetical protein BD779DRAFT_155163 [Infundibulicybe gibba]|nr:hypothetical protein BD779DRAFT_155163 [Infundibulicybe gibba]